MSQREAVLQALRAAGPRGATNGQLNRICFRYAARIFELRRRGYSIRTQTGKDGLRIFFLDEEPSPQPVPPPSASSNDVGGGEQAALFEFPSQRRSLNPLTDPEAA